MKFCESNVKRIRIMEVCKDFAIFGIFKQIQAIVGRLRISLFNPDKNDVRCHFAFFGEIVELFFPNIDFFP